MRNPHTIPSNYAATGAVSGAWAGWLLGLCVGVGGLSFSELGLVLAGGSVAVAFLAGSGGAVAGTLIGGLVGALIGRTPRQKEHRSKDRLG
jgi:hypothetical protein